MLNTVVSNIFIYSSGLFQLQLLPGIKLGNELALTWHTFNGPDKCSAAEHGILAVSQKVSFLFSDLTNLGLISREII